MPTLKSIRDKEVWAIVKSQVNLYLNGIRKRRCATCGESFSPTNRYNFFCRGKGCRHKYYRGQFMPRKDD